MKKRSSTVLDHAAVLALDWNREWLIPATTNAWFPVKIFKDVALPGVYKVTVTGSTNVTVRYGDTRVRGGQSEEVGFPLAQSQETLEVQAAAPGAAALTVSFTGTGTATNYNCSTYVNVKAFGTKVEPDMNGDNVVDEADDALVRQQRVAGAVFDALYGVASNVFHRIKFSFSGDVPPGDSELRLVLRGAPGAFRIRANLLDPPLAVSSAQGTECTLSAGSGFGDRTLLLECLSPSSGSASCVYRNGGSDYNLTASSTVSFVAADIGLCTDTDNDGDIAEDPDGERAFAQYAPGRILVMKGNADGGISNSPRAETRFRLKPDILAQSGVVTLIALQGASRAGLWDARQGGTAIPSGTAYSLPQMPPQTLWVSGVSTGTAVLATSYAMVPGGQSVSNLTAYTVIHPISQAPASSNAYVWCSLPSLGAADGEMFRRQIDKITAGFNVTWFEDGDGTNTSDFGTCILANYKKIANAGAFTIISHGDPGEHLVVYAPFTPTGKVACDEWRANEVGMMTKTNLVLDADTGMIMTNESYYYVSVSSAWLAANWKPSLDANRAIALWSICYSANTEAGTSVKEAAGGRWRGGYVDTTGEQEAESVNEKFLKRMNGSTDGALKRTAGEAYNGGSDYTSNLRMDGDSWTTLCPAPLGTEPVYPASPVTEKRKGWGCILLDTALDNTPSAADAIVKTSGDAVVSNCHWLSNEMGLIYGVGFLFDKTQGNDSTIMNAISDKIRTEGTGPRRMDGNRIQPNTDDKQWSF